MPLSRMILAAALLASLAACGAPASPSTAQSEAPVVDGACVISRYTLSADHPTTARLAGKTFQVTEAQVTWDHGGSVKLQPNWGLLEMRQSPAGVDISLDGVVVATAQ
jgi:hypothetical protein